jgi:primosomal protein N' (replication factor Y)
MQNTATYFVDVILPLSVPNLYTYRIPRELNDLVQAGCRVVVQFGKNKLYTALIKNIHQQAPKDYTAKYIDAIVDETPVLNQLQFKFWDWMCFYYMCYPGEVMNAALPSGLKLNSETKIILNSDFDFSTLDLNELNEKENKVIDQLQLKPQSSIIELAAALSIKNIQPTIHSLTKKNIILVQEEIHERYKPRLIPYVKLNDDYLHNESKMQELFDQLEKKALKQLQAILLYLNKAGNINVLLKKNEVDRWVKKSLLTDAVDSSPVQALIKKGIFDVKEFEISRLKIEQEKTQEVNLSEIQLNAYHSIQSNLKDKNTVLLHGITGSGKTEIYIKLIQDALNEGKQVLFLVPEIALTSQLIYRIRKFFGDRSGVYHSKFSENERVEIWNNISGALSNNYQLKQNKNYDIILGTRSALFLPFHKLGLIIIDEEHDTSYKQQDQAPRYHARDAAIYLANLHQAKVVLGSATPSIESYFNAEEGKFGLVKINERFGGTLLPEIEIIDTGKTKEPSKNKSLFSDELKSQIKLALDQKQQVILFQNRRGFAPYTECVTCNWIPHCTQCDVALIYHKSSARLVCHYCGYSISPPSTCSACGNSDLRHKGFGTEKIEEEIEIIFPNAKIARLDIDSTRSKHAYRQIIDDFDQHKVDILVGTQMVTKGLDFEHVSLVGIINADQQLNFPDFRSYERAFQIITQVSGRAGRRNKQGKVVIQTSKVTHPVLELIKQNNFEELYRQQITDRNEFLYPPFYRLIEFTFISADLDLLNESASFFANQLKKDFNSHVLGPEFPLISKIRNEYLKKIIIKVSRNFSVIKVRESLSNHLASFKTDKEFKKVKIKIDVDPI